MGMTDNPVGHKTAVASAGDTDTAFIDLWICRQHLIGKLHDIIIIFLSITSTDVCKAVSSSISAAWIAEEYEVTAVCPVLHFVIEHSSVNGLWTAMNIQNCRIALLWVKSDRLKHPSVDLHSIGISKTNHLWCYH